MVKVSIILPPTDFKDETLSQLSLLLGKKGIEYELLSISNTGECKGHHGAVVKQKDRADEFEPILTDALLIIDGPGIEENRLFENRAILDRIRIAKEAKKPIVAVGNGIKLIAKANIVKDTKVADTNDPDINRLVELYRGKVVNEPVVLSNGILTASSSEHMLELVNALADMLGVS